jgi:hypothetical protein
MNAILELYDESWGWGGGYADPEPVDNRSPEERLSSKLAVSVKGTCPKPPKDNRPDRALIFLEENWDSVYDYSKKYIFYQRHDVILDLLSDHFGHYNKANVKYFLFKKGIFSTVWYVSLYLMLTVLTLGFCLYLIHAHDWSVSLLFIPLFLAGFLVALVDP